MEKTTQNNYESIKTIQDAIEATGRPSTPEFMEVPEDMREFFKGMYNAVVTTEAINEGKKLDWAAVDQRKHIPWFYCEPKASSGFAFSGARYCYSYAGAGVTSRLCFIDEARARYAGQQFIAVHDTVLRK